MSDLIQTKDKLKLKMYIICYEKITKRCPNSIFFKKTNSASPYVVFGFPMLQAMEILMIT